MAKFVTRRASRCIAFLAWTPAAKRNQGKTAGEMPDGAIGEVYYIFRRGFPRYQYRFDGFRWDEFVAWRKAGSLGRYYNDNIKIG